ncbi:unnamed protein product [Leptidea sinapis]|uniref:Uncharacterized protein n=1 Tax=Leptidea sinapis TaxID=189913 RepID=A0A5E4QF82_9NEOP|nr:unnamed protein product [Leptidea sinapis]
MYVRRHKRYLLQYLFCFLLLRLSVKRARGVPCTPSLKYQ